LPKARNTIIKSSPSTARKAVQERWDNTQTKEDLENLVRAEQSRADQLLKNEISTAISQQGLVNQQRQHGAHKASAKLQSILTTFSSFLESYSGIVEVVKQASPQLGGVAYSMLSVFLMVSSISAKPKDFPEFP
jgi:hypothetical protein